MRPDQFRTIYTSQNWIGRSQWPADPYFNGLIDEFRIYNGVAIPYAPTLTRLIPGGGKIKLEFTASTVAGATAASSYMAICQAANGTRASVSGTSSPLTVTGLADGVSYVCTVMAVNTLGLFSASSDILTKRAGADLTPILMLLLD
jgi:hypothetical protein